MTSTAFYVEVIYNMKPELMKADKSEFESIFGKLVDICNSNMLPVRIVLLCSYNVDVLCTDVYTARQFEQSEFANVNDIEDLYI